MSAVLSRFGRGVLSLTAACLLTAYAAILLLASPFTQHLLGAGSGPVPLGDFGSFYASGQAAGRGLDPFDVYPLTLNADLGRGHGAAINLNAPLSIVLFQTMTLLDPPTARLGWFAASLGCYAITVALLLRWNPAGLGPFRLVWPFAMAGFWETLNLGQVYAFLGLLTAGAWILLESHPILAGVLMGPVIAFKPNFIVWPFFLALVGWRKGAAGAVLSTFFFSGIPMVLYGPGVYGQWFAALRTEGPNGSVANAAIAGLVARLGAPQAALLAAPIVLAVLAWWIWRRRPKLGDTGAIGLVGMLLGAPLAWLGYTVFLLPIFLHRRWTVPIGLAATLLLVPRRPLQEWSDTSPIVLATAGSIYTLAWLLVLWNLSREVRRARTEAHQSTSAQPRSSAPAPEWS